jgi:hypothetical protein
MYRHASLISAICAAFLWVGVATAEPTYEFAFDSDNYLVAPGGTVDITVYLKETVNEGPSVLNSDGVGIFGAGARLNFDGTSPTRAKVLYDTNITPNPVFTNISDPGIVIKSVTDTTAQLIATMGLISLDVAHADDPTLGMAEYLMTIGTFKFTAGSVPGEVTSVYTSRVLNEGDEEIDAMITGDIIALDSVVGQSGFTITTIPEPSTLLLSGMAAVAIFAFRCRRRRESRVAIERARRNDGND